MKKWACVKVTDLVGLDAWPLAAVRLVAETLQSSIRPRGAGQSAFRGSGAQSSSAAVPWWRPDFHASSPEQRTVSGARGAFKWSTGAHGAAVTGRALAGPGACRQRISPSRRP
jgi:hypothetical protein